MKITYRVPTDTFAFVEVVDELTVDEQTRLLIAPEDIRARYDTLKQAFTDGQGVGMKDFAKIVHEYCTTGAIVDGGDKDFSANEKLLLGEIKKLVRKDK